MQLEIELTNETEDAVLDQGELRSIIEPLIVAEGLEGEWLLEVRFVDVDTMMRLNRQAQGRNEATDVLSFPIHFATNAANPATMVPSIGPRLLGSVVIAPAIAAEQAPRHNRTTREELRFLVDHGTRHLLGYDHDDHAQWLPSTRQP